MAAAPTTALRAVPPPPLRQGRKAPAPFLLPVKRSETGEGTMRSVVEGAL